MKNFWLGVAILLLDLVIIVAGITCLIIGCISDSISRTTEVLLILGWIGVGAGTGTCLGVFGTAIMVNDL